MVSAPSQQLKTLVLLALAGLLAHSFVGGAAAQGHQIEDFDGDLAAEFRNVGDQIHMRGTIFGSGPNRTLTRFQTALARNPGAKTLVIHVVLGAEDDDNALDFYRAVRRNRLNTLLAAGGVAASGGVDLFCAGMQRTVEPGGKLLVHPWQDDNLGSGANVAPSNPIHDRYRNYYAEMGVDTAFYEHTLRAPLGLVVVDGGEFTVGIPEMHDMSRADMIRFRLVTNNGTGGGVGNTVADNGNSEPGTLGNGTGATVPSDGSTPGGQGPAPGTIPPIGQLAGTYSFQFGEQPVSVTLNADSTFQYSVANSSTNGTFSLTGATLTLFIPNFTPTTRQIAGANNNQIRFADGVVWQRAQATTPSETVQPGTGVPGTTAEVQPLFNIEGSWLEVRTRGRDKPISLSNGVYVESSGRRDTRGSFTLTGDLLTISLDGETERFRIQPVGTNRINFSDADNGRAITRFHWVRRN